MAKITFEFNVPCGHSYSVKVGEQEKIVEDSRPNVSFDVENGEHHVYIEQFLEPEPSGLIYRIFEVVTLPLSGVLNIIFSNNDTDWEKDICPYGLKSLVKLNVSGDETFHITLNNSKFSEETNSFILPSVETDPVLLAKTEALDNEGDIDRCYKSFIRRIYSILSVILILFGFFLYISVKQNLSTFLLIFLGTVMLFVSAGIIWTNIYHNRKRNVLHGIFNSQK
ncbi:MAG: hypothetical protein E7614_06715 [Ruminococcaceae bacterium]|nr:hypothetical protein [Oscillospiraceae bacterium]